MKTFLSGLDNAQKMKKATDYGHKYLFASYGSLGGQPARRLKQLTALKPDDAELWLDNGCFKIQSHQIEDKPLHFDAETYTRNFIELLKYNNHYKEIDHYAAIDPHIDAQETVKKTLKMMENEGLSPIPVWHFDWSLDDLETFIGSYDRIAIGKLAHGKINEGERKLRLLKALQICREHGTKPHLFGVGNSQEMMLYRNLAYSIDTTNWLDGRYGWKYKAGPQYYGHITRHRVAENSGGNHLEDHNLKAWKQYADHQEQFGDYQ